MSARALAAACELLGEWRLLGGASFEILGFSFFAIFADEIGGATPLVFIVLLICFFSLAGVAFAFVSLVPCFLLVGLLRCGCWWSQSLEMWLWASNWAFRLLTAISLAA